jgi:deoxyribodipyrimidine photo-lyase
MKKYSTAIVWFRNDLRTRDHEALTKAIRSAETVLPVFIFDPRVLSADARTTLGFQKTGAIRAQFILESLHDLRTSLQARGGDLLVRHGNPESVLPALMQEFSAQAIYFHEEATDEEIHVEEALETALQSLSAKTHGYWGATLYHIDDLPFSMDTLPDVFTQFRKSVEKGSTVRTTFAPPDSISLPVSFDSQAAGEIPTLRTLGYTIDDTDDDTDLRQHDERAVLLFKGGENEAWKRLQSYIWDGDHLKQYKETRNGLVGADYSSKFSAWLAAGCISPRSIYDEVKKYERERIKNDSTYWLVFELLWRDFFRFVAFAWENQLFFDGGLKGERKQWVKNWDIFERWKQGMTGIPFIDANMRELATTGFMSNRGRQNVASFLVRDLNLHWLMGAEYFESQLVDYDVCSNYGNWNYAAGIGNDPREDRYFNIMRQASMYDPRGDYVKQWISELRNIPTQYVHEPYKLSREQQRQYGMTLGVDYPNPVVNLELTSKKFQRE